MTKPTLLTDSHCHLDFPDFDNEITDIVKRAISVGVHRMITICTKLREEPKVRAIAENFSSVFYAAGTHPMSAASEPMASAELLVELSRHPKFVGVGETGLDYHYTYESAEIQKTSLLIHINAAQITQLPLIIHSRAADEDMSNILKSEYRNAPFRAPLIVILVSSKKDHPKVPEMEQIIINAAKDQNSNGLMLDPSFTQNMIKAIAKSYEKASSEGNTPIFLTSPVIRRQLSNLIRHNLEDLNVLSFTELPENRKVQVVATIENNKEVENKNKETS